MDKVSAITGLGAGIAVILGSILLLLVREGPQPAGLWGIILGVLIMLAVAYGAPQLKINQRLLFGILLVLIGAALIALPVYIFLEPLFAHGKHLFKGDLAKLLYHPAAVMTGFLFGGIGLMLLFPPGFGKKVKKLTKPGIQSPNAAPSVGGGLAIPGQTIDAALVAFVRSNSALSAVMGADTDLANKIQGTLDSYNPSRGVFGSWAERIRSESRGKQLEALNKEQLLLIEQAAMFEKQVIEGQRRKAEYDKFIIENFIVLKHAGEALAKGMTVEDYSEVKKHEEKVRIDRDFEQWRIDQQLEAAQRYKMNEDALLDKLREELKRAILERDDLTLKTELSPAAMFDLSNMVESKIANLRARIIAREKRLENDDGV